MAAGSDDSPDSNRGATTVQVSRQPAAPDTSGRSYLLVFEGETSFMAPVDPDAEVIIGRGDRANVVLADAAASRRHARLSLAEVGATLTDLGSQNGTRVNGRRIDDDTVVHSGDVITIGSATLVFHGASRRAGKASPLELSRLRERITDDLSRNLDQDNDIGVVCIVGTSREATDKLVATLVRAGEYTAWAGDDQLFVVIPNTAAETATTRADQILHALSEVSPQVTAGIAVAPEDGCDADVLLAGARNAARCAEPQQASLAADSFGTFSIGGSNVIVADPAMTRLYALIERVARADLPVLVIGETGTGKELAATAVHERSPRHAGPLIALNCAAIAETLVESELFGHEKGAFSGAVAAKQGMFEAASGGTVFLDEIGELSSAIQAKLLRVLETQTVTRVGAVEARPIDIRLVAATNRQLVDEVRAGRFRQDLYFRLSGATVWLPPLRDRPRELPLLAEMFLNEACARLDRPAMTLSAAALHALAEHSWPGNIRELKLTMEFVAAACPDDVVEPHHFAHRLVDDVRAQPDEHTAAKREPGFRPLADELRELEITRIKAALDAAEGNQTRAAQLIGMPLRTLISKLKRYDLVGYGRE